MKRFLHGLPLLMVLTVILLSFGILLSKVLNEKAFIETYRPYYNQEIYAWDVSKNPDQEISKADLSHYLEQHPEQALELSLKRFSDTSVVVAVFPETCVKPANMFQGEFFSPGSKDEPTAVLGRKAFHDNQQLLVKNGKMQPITLLGTDYRVIGVIDEAGPYDNHILINAHSLSNHGSLANSILSLNVLTSSEEQPDEAKLMELFHFEEMKPLSVMLPSIKDFHEAQRNFAKTAPQILLISFLTLFLIFSNFYGKLKREFALKMVVGANFGQLLAELATKYGVFLCISMSVAAFCQSWLAKRTSFARFFPDYSLHTFTYLLGLGLLIGVIYLILLGLLIRKISIIQLMRKEQS